MFVRYSLIALSIASISACGDSGPSQDEINAFKQGLKDNMVFVKGGTFMMGDQGRMLPDYKGNIGHLFWAYGDNNKPAVKVTLSDYSIYKYPVSWAEYDIFRHAVGKEIRFEQFIGNPNKEWREANFHALYENWQDAREYCQWAGQQIGKQWDLPTEAQWEYAARDRGENKPFAYDFPLDKFSYESDEVRGLIMSPYLEPVDAMAPNKLGLYQMNGNASDLVYDWYAEGWPYKDTVVDPTGINTGVKKVTRGGNQGNSPLHNTNFSRYHANPDKDAHTVQGWRCAQSHIKLP